ncbi:glycoside hydrolase family 15 protein [Proteobacteria bacterium 005FR1]|nr:glycoside hydrolase family 15 protein [Proteobacteria bacterium 005FR1]
MSTREASASAGKARDTWPAIGDYGLIGDSRTAALVGLDGGIDWLCLPNFSGPAFFARLLDRQRGGYFQVRPAHPSQRRADQTYVADSNVLETRFRSGTGVALRLTDAMTIPPSAAAEQLRPQRELLRKVEALEDTEIEIIFEPRPDYARARTALRRYGKLGWTCSYRDHFLLLHTDLPVELTEDRQSVRAIVRLQRGERRFLSLSYVRRDIGIILPLGNSAEQRLIETRDWWRDWSSHCRYQGPYREAVLRSALTLKLLTFCLSGAVVAAPTTSLPEAVGSSRNWDYRYCWLRDASLTLDAFVDLGYHSEADEFIGWLLYTTALSRPKLQVLYDVYGESRIPEHSLESLQGYRDSRPVRIGNAAWRQTQLDVYGMVVMAAADYVRAGGRISRDGRKMLLGFGKLVCQLWRDPDHGLWEARGRKRHHTHSKVTCWAALNSLLALAEERHLQVPEDGFRGELSAIRDAIEAKGFDRELNSYTDTFDSNEPDASLLLMPRFGYLPPDDPRMLGTIRYILDKLSSGPLLYRYPPGSDELAGKEAPFGICSFWAVEALARAGRVEEATERFEQLLEHANHLGLYSEEISADTGEAIGNFPQAFTHVGLINAALSLAAASEHGGSKPT